VRRKAERSDKESANELPMSLKVTIHRHFRRFRSSMSDISLLCCVRAGLLGTQNGVRRGAEEFPTSSHQLRKRFHERKPWFSRSIMIFNENLWCFRLRRSIRSSDVLPRGSKAKSKEAWRCKTKSWKIRKAARSDKGSAKELPKTSKVTIHPPCRRFRSSMSEMSPLCCSRAGTKKEPKNYILRMSDLNASTQDGRRIFL